VKGFYTFVYAATSDSFNKGAGDDTIKGFPVSLKDLLDFYLLNQNLRSLGQLTGNTVNADSIPWIYSKFNAMLYVNDTNGSLNSSWFRFTAGSKAVRTSAFAISPGCLDRGAPSSGEAYFALTMERRLFSGLRSLPRRFP
jgi:hypothetical protein